MKIKKISQSSGIVAQVENVLTSTSTTNALSANQGRLLNTRLVGEVVLSSTNTNLTINGLDIVRDGGVYEFEVTGIITTAADIGITVNGDTGSNYICRYFNNYASTSGAASGVSCMNFRFDVGYNITKGTITLAQNRVTIIADNISMDVSGTSYFRHIYLYYINAQSNFTQFNITTSNGSNVFAVGSRARVWKR